MKNEMKYYYIIYLINGLGIVFLIQNTHTYIHAYTHTFSHTITEINTNWNDIEESFFPVASDTRFPLTLIELQWVYKKMDPKDGKVYVFQNCFTWEN